MKNEIPQTIEQAKQVLKDFLKKTLVTPAHVVTMYIKDFREGSAVLYPWQAKVHKEYLCKEYTSEHPLEMCAVCVNGSGKDLLVISPFEAWFMLTKEDGTIITTSSSGTQLKNQTEKYIRNLCQTINTFHGLDIFDIKERHITCTLTNSQLHMFATDEAGKAEGYHPAGANSPFAIIINEGKSIHPDIFEALTRCTGFQYWLEISSPGRPEGHFYQMFTSSRTITNLQGVVEPAVKTIRVTSDDCPHLGTTYKDRLRELYGESSALYRSMVYADFSSTDEQVVLTFDKYNRAIKFQADWFNDTAGNIAGLDLSGGGDEQVLTIRNGNKLIAQHSFRIKDAVVLVTELIKLFERYQLKNRPINADAGNMGKTIIDMLHARGWKNVRYIWNQSAPNDELAYANLGAEMWHKLASLYENNELCFADAIIHNVDLRTQLCNRYYKYNTKNQVILESKPQAKAKGHPSPDRADSLALCFLNYVTPKQVLDRKSRQKEIDDEQDSISMGVPSIRKLVLGISNNLKMHNEVTKLGGTISAISKQSRNALQLELRQTLNAAFKNN